MYKDSVAGCQPAQVVGSELKEHNSPQSQGTSIVTPSLPDLAQEHDCNAQMAGNPIKGQASPDKDSNSAGSQSSHRLFSGAPYEAAFSWLGCFLVAVLIIIGLGLFWTNSLLDIGKYTVAVIFLPAYLTILLVLERLRCLQPRWPETKRAEFAAPNAFASKPTYWLMLAALYAVSFTSKVFIGGMIADHAQPPLDATEFPHVAVISMGVFAVEFMWYFYHYLQHKTILYRLHQMHHTPKKYDFSSAAYGHPLERMFNALFVFFPLLIVKMSVLDLMWIESVIFAMSSLGHANIRTPWILGFFVTRPEQHAIHHEEPWPRPEGWKRRAFSDLPFIDYFFGTGCNPKQDPRELPDFAIGLGGNIDKLNDMVIEQLLFVDLRALRAQLMEEENGSDKV